MLEQPAHGQMDVPVVSPPETWVTLGDLSRRTGIHPDTIRSAVRMARARQEAWVKKAPDPRHTRWRREAWWINTASPAYQEQARQWSVRASRLGSPTRLIPLIRRAHAYKEQLPLDGSNGQLLTTYLASQGLEIYSNVLDTEQETPWKWQWGDLHGEHYSSQEEALIAALHSKIG